MPRIGQVGVVINGHREGALLGHSLESLALAKAYAAERECAVDIHLVLDRPDDATIAVARRYDAQLASLQEVEFGNLGASREAGLARTDNEWIAFLDGDDLVSRNWLYDAFGCAQVSASNDTVFHTEMFIGFGAEVFFRRAMRTSDIEFDPLCLIADWFFCNNLFAHRSVFERCPIEPYDHEKGLGSEDWHWSCQTTAAGFKRDFVPRTTYFYRVKPASESLGMTGGLVHKASRLFTREAVSSLKARRPGAAEPSSTTPAPETPRLRGQVPDWVSEQALDQAETDAQLVEVARFMKNHPNASRTFPPRMHYGVAEFYRRSAPRLTDAKKIAIFWGDAERIGRAHLLPRLIDVVRAKSPEHQVVVFAETDSLAAEAIDQQSADADIVVLDYAAARAKFAIPEHYLAMLTARYFLQFDFELIVSVGGKAFDEVVSRFDRAIAHRCPKLIDIVPLLTFDRVNPVIDRFTTALPARARFEHSVMCLSEPLRQFVSAATLGGADVRFSSQLRAAVKDALRLRWSGDQARMAAAYEAVDFSVLFEAPRRAPRKSATRADRDLAVVVLANGACPELAAVHEHAVRPTGAALHVFAAGAQADLVKRRIKAVAGQVTLHTLPAWNAAEALEALGRVEATWLAVLESGAVVSPQFLEGGITRLRECGGRGAAIASALMRRNGRSWDLQEFNEPRISVEGETSVLFGGLDPIGAVLMSSVGLADCVLPSARSVLAPMFPNLLALAAARKKMLRVVQGAITVNVMGAPWRPDEWARLVSPPRPDDLPRRGVGGRA